MKKTTMTAFLAMGMAILLLLALLPFARLSKYSTMKDWRSGWAMVNKVAVLLLFLFVEMLACLSFLCYNTWCYSALKGDFFPWLIS